MSSPNRLGKSLEEPSTGTEKSGVAAVTAKRNDKCMRNTSDRVCSVSRLRRKISYCFRGIFLALDTPFTSSAYFFFFCIVNLVSFFLASFPRFFCGLLLAQWTSQLFAWEVWPHIRREEAANMVVRYSSKEKTVTCSLSVLPILRWRSAVTPNLQATASYNRQASVIWGKLGGTGGAKRRFRRTL